MNPQLRVVTHQPVTELWRNDGFCTTQREAWLSAAEVSALLQLGPVQFVISSVGGPLDWIPPERRFDFWKREVKPHLAEPSNSVSLAEFPGEYCYFASRWAGDSLPIILLETHH